MRNDDEDYPGTTDRAAVLRALVDRGCSGGCGFRVLGECENGAGSNRGSTAKGSAPFCRGQGARGCSHDDAKWSGDSFALTGHGRRTCGEVGDSVDECARADSG